MRRKIIYTTIDEINANGLKFTISDLAKRLYVSKRTIYEFFSSKEELISAAIEQVFLDIQARQNEIIKDDRLSLIEKLKQIIVIPADFECINEKNLNQVKIFYPNEYQKIQEWEDKLNVVKKMLDEGLIDPTLYDVNFDVLAKMIHLFVHGVLETNFLKQKDLTVKQALTAMSEILLFGLMGSEKRCRQVGSEQ